MYFHCASHELNLRLSKVSHFPEVRKHYQPFGLNFKFLAKRQRIFEVPFAEINKKV